MRETTIVIPCFNEAARLDPEVFRQYAEDHPDVGFLFVNDGSSDATGELLGRAAASHEGLSHLDLELNQGKAEAVRRGVLHALESAPSFVGYWDADLATPLEDIGAFRTLFESAPDVLLVMGSRVKLLGRSIERGVARHYVGRVFATFASLALGLPVYDTQCGAKLFRMTSAARTIWDDPFLSRWVFDVELIARLGQLEGVDPHAAIREQPLAQWHDKPGSKVKFSDGIRAGIDLARIAWRYR